MIVSIGSTNSFAFSQSIKSTLSHQKPLGYPAFVPALPLSWRASHTMPNAFPSKSVLYKALMSLKLSISTSVYNALPLYPIRCGTAYL